MSLSDDDVAIYHVFQWVLQAMLLSACSFIIVGYPTHLKMAM
jgi:hypothetical protein